MDAGWVRPDLGATSDYLCRSWERVHDFGCTGSDYLCPSCADAPETPEWLDLLRASRAEQQHEEQLREQLSIDDDTCLEWDTEDLYPTETSRFVLLNREAVEGTDEDVQQLERLAYRQALLGRRMAKLRERRMERTEREQRAARLARRRSPTVAPRTCAGRHRRASRPAAARRRGSRRVTASARAGPDDPAEPEPASRPATTYTYGLRARELAEVGA